jgi:predicted acyltransferase
MTICFMIIVNTPGTGATPFAPLLHATWHGFTPTDLVFPSFLFAVGNAMSFSMLKNKAQGNRFIYKVLKRTLLIFLLGYLMYWFPFFAINSAGNWTLTPIHETRIMGVLQRIALCYFFASIMLQYLSTRKVILLSASLLLLYWILLLLFSAPGDPYSMERNAGELLDKFLLGSSHLYHGEGVAFDPEGILSTLPAIVNVIIGYYAGKYLQQKGKTYEALTKLLLVGCFFILIALMWNTVFPINKKLWTSSFVLLTSGLDLVIISALVYAVEMGTIKKGTWTYFFTVFGKNPLFIYLLSELLIIILYRITVAPDTNMVGWINTNLYQAIAPGPVGSLLFALSFMMLCWLVGLVLEKNKIYIKV